MKPPNETGAGAATPDPQAIAMLATAISTYSANGLQCNTNEQWLAVPRTVVELAIDIGLDWLDLTDRMAGQQEQLPENAL